MAQNSSLEFKLHRLYFISLLMGGTANQREALQYAKNFQPFALNHQKGEVLVTLRGLKALGCALHSEI